MFSYIFCYLYCAKSQQGLPQGALPYNNTKIRENPNNHMSEY